MLQEVVEIYEDLVKKGIDATIVSATTIKPLDQDYLLNEVLEYDNVFVFEESYIKNSFSSSILEFYNDRSVNKIIYRINLMETIIPHGKRDVLMKEFSMRGQNLIERIEGLVYGGKK